MSVFIELLAWKGDDADMAAASLAKVFRMNGDESVLIMRRLRTGCVWKFEHTVSDSQAEKASAILQKSGFDLKLSPVAPVLPDAKNESLSLSVPANTPPTGSPPSVSPLPAAENQAPLKQAGSGAVSTAASPGFAFYGTGGDLFSIALVNLAFNVLTLGVYHFWGQTRTRNYLLSQSSFAGDRFAYHGTGKELFLGFLKLAGILLGAGLAIYLLASVMGGADFLEFLELFANLATLAFFLTLPVLMAGAWQYRLTRTSWRGIRFAFKGDRRTAFFLFIKGWFLCVVTLGLYAPFFFAQRQKFWRGHSCFGSMKFEFSGEGKDLFGRFFIASLLAIPTLGLSWIWYKAFVQQYLWSHTRISEGCFRFSATVKEWMILSSVNFLMLTLTLGFAHPWVTARSQKFFCDHLALEGALDLDAVVQSMMRSGALGEDMADAFDVGADVLG